MGIKLSTLSTINEILISSMDILISNLDEIDCGGIYIVDPSGEGFLTYHSGFSEEYAKSRSHFSAKSTQITDIKGKPRE